jgi:hypothetical protein
MTLLVVAAGIVGTALCLLIVSSLISGRFTPWSKNSERFRDAPLSFVLQQTILILVGVSIVCGIWKAMS